MTNASKVTVQVLKYNAENLVQARHEEYACWQSRPPLERLVAMQELIRRSPKPGGHFFCNSRRAICRLLAEARGGAFLASVISAEELIAAVAESKTRRMWKLFEELRSKSRRRNRFVGT